MGSSHGKSSTIKDRSVEGTAYSDAVETFMTEEKEEILHTRRRKLNPRLSRGVPKGKEGELVAAGWPNWLAAVAGDALNGWLPRRADTYEKIDRIGQGTYSNVYKARDLLLGKVVALKKVRFDNLDPESVKFMAREITILRRLGDHPNVIKLEGLVTSKMSCSLYLVFDCMENDLKGIQEQKGVKFSEPEIKCYMNQLLKGLDHCHSRGILHRDVTTSNLLVNKEGILKIADFGLSTFFDTEQNIPLTSKIVTLWYRPPELLLGSNYYGVGVDLWGVGCVLGELFTGKPILPGKTEIEQLYKIFRLCGSPSDDFWRKSKLPNVTIFKPREPCRRNLQATFHDLPAAALGLMDTLLSIDAEYRGTAALALQGEFFTTEPFACDPSSLPQCPPSTEIDAKKTEIKGRRVRNYARDRSVRAIPAPDANAELKSNIDRRRLLTPSKARNKLEETNGHASGGVLNEGTNSSSSCQESSRKEGSQSYTQSSVTPHQRNDRRALMKEPIHDDLDSKGKKKWSSPLPDASDKTQDLLRQHDAMIHKAVTRARLEKGSTANWNDHDSKGKKNHSLCPSSSTSHETVANNQISTPLPVKSINMQGLLEEHKTWILKDAQWVVSDEEKMAEGKGNNSEVEKYQLTQLSPAESDDLDFLEDNQYFGPLSSASKPIDVDRILREHDRQIQESVERAKQLKKLAKARY